MSKTYDEWLKYYEGCNKAQVIFDIMLDGQEIERLQEENLLLKASEPMSKLAEDYGYKAETERLNNIINNLNNGIKELDNMFYETFRISQNGYYSISEWELKGFTDKLQELKGSE